MYKYSFNVGLNDKDTYKPLDPNHAIKVIKEIAIKYSKEGYSIYTVNGGYMMNNGVHVEEDGIKIDIVRNARDLDFKAFASELKIALNQESVMFEMVKTEIEFL